MTDNLDYDELDPFATYKEEDDPLKNAIVADAPYDKKEPELNHLKETLTGVRKLITEAVNYLNEDVPRYGPAHTVLSAAYKFAPSRETKQFISEANRLTKRCLTLKDRMEAKGEALRGKGIKRKEVNARLEPLQNDLNELHDEAAIRLNNVVSLLETEGYKLDGSFTSRIKDRFTVNLTEFDQSNMRVVVTTAPLLISVRRPITPKQIEDSSYGIEHLESFLYIFKEAKIAGYLPTQVPREIEVASMRKTALSCGYDISIAPLRMSHPTSKRIWFLILEFPLVQRSCQFADKSASPEFEAFRHIANSNSYDEVAVCLTTMGFGDVQRTDILTRWAASDNSRTRNAILMTALLNKQRQDTQNRLRQLRLSFEASKTDELKTIRLLEDDYHTYGERMSELSLRFQYLTSPDADADNGIAIGSYAKLNNVFELFLEQATRSDKDSFVRRKAKAMLVNDRIEAREVYYEYVSLSKKRKQCLATIKAIKARIEQEREDTRKV